MKQEILLKTWDSVTLYISEFGFDSAFVNNLVTKEYPADIKDCFSKSQLASKYWLRKTLLSSKILDKEYNCIIVGAWYGTLGHYLQDLHEIKKIDFNDINPECFKYFEQLNHNTKCRYNTYIIDDMNNLSYENYNMVVNTSTEHLIDVPLWSSKIKEGTLVIAQNTNYIHDDHKSCYYNARHFSKSLNLTTIQYEGTLRLPMYNRYMTIGIK